jgi:hypothetical protein
MPVPARWGAILLYYAVFSGKTVLLSKQPKQKGARPIEKQPIVIHMNQLLLELDEGPLRAAYMVIKELHDLQQASRKE